MNYIAEITETMNHLKAAEESIERLKEDYKDNPMLLSFYMPSSEKLVEMLKIRLNSLMQEYLGGTSVNPDIWIRLQGKVFDNGRAPLGVVGTFIKKLVTANQHAVALLEQVKYEGIRINKKIKELAELDLVVTAPGSLKLGIKKPELNKFYNCEVEGENGNIDENMILNCIEEATKESEKGIEGLQLLSRAIIAASDEEELKVLSEDVKDSKNLLKLLHYAREIAPTQSSQIESITFSGVLSPKSGYREVVVSKETRVKLRDMSNNLLGNDKYIEGIGTVRALDFDKLTFRIDSLKFDKVILDNIECKVNEKEFSEEDIEKIANKQIRLSGILVYSSTGTAKWLEVDKIYFDEDDDDFEK